MMNFVIFLLIIAGGLGFFHLGRVKMKNKAEMAKFEERVVLKADLGKVLIVYYTLSGKTRDIVTQIANKTNADVYEIRTKEVYSSPSVYLKSKKELKSKNYPEIFKDSLPDVSKYDFVFVGGPVWWYTMAPAMFSYLKDTDFGGVKVVPFSTQGSNVGSYFEDFAKTAKNAKILQGEKFNNMDERYQLQVSNKVNAWLNRLSK
ncbi:MAG: hypothetical protein J6T72_00950 [Alphaproteobacteria bacterium]|nr:hypothetical protein [Alphaproteobacteria bacterium]